MRVVVYVIVYAICMGITEGFAPGTLVSRTGLSKKCLHMCAAKDAAHVGQGRKVLDKAAALLTALCIGTAVAPSASRARDLSPEALAALSAASSSLVAQVMLQVQILDSTLRTLESHTLFSSPRSAKLQASSSRTPLNALLLNQTACPSIGSSCA
jgi:hypothetical protein